MTINILDVEHGFFSHIVTPNQKNILIDVGSSPDFCPTKYLQSKQISLVDLLIISNKDDDHLSGLANLKQHMGLPFWIRKNPSITEDAFKRMKKAPYSSGIEAMFHVIRTYTTTLDGSFFDYGGLRIASCHNLYPDFTDTNNLSLVTFVSFGSTKIVFPGDILRAGWLKLLENPDVQSELRDVNIFVASHHGRDNGCCEEVFKYCKPDITIISDKNIIYDTQNTTEWYRTKTQGVLYGDKERKVFSTRSDGHITLHLSQNDYKISTSKSLLGNLLGVLPNPNFSTATLKLSKSPAWQGLRF